MTGKSAYVNRLPPVLDGSLSNSWSKGPVEESDGKRHRTLFLVFELFLFFFQSYFWMGSMRVRVEAL